MKDDIMMLAGKTALVTGSNSGIGLGIARALAAAGADVVLNSFTDRPEDHAIATAIAAEFGVKARYIKADMSKGDECRALVAQAGRCDILVNNAGIQHVASIESFPPEKWDAIIAINLTSAFHTTAIALPMMRAAGWGRIINIASQAAKTGFPHLPAYVSSKHGMVGLTRASAVELGAHGITVNAVCPNHVTTGLGAQQNEYFSKLLGFAKVEDYLANMAAKNPMGRPGLPSDTAAACLWLASEAAFYVTGEALNVSGGEEMH
jgi:meso-butanediol dehydrogenase/(S,S)-butanediol dehydrogenase/diacetyl reductase